MTDPNRDYEQLAERLTETGRDVDAISRALSAFDVETPSWGYGDSGTRFAVFPQPGRPRDVFERLEDAAEVHRLTGAAPAVALHFPWDAVDDLGALREHIEALGLRIGAVNPNLFQDPDYKLGSVTHPDARGAREGGRAPARVRARSPPSSGSTAQSLWLADGTNYAGQDDLRARRAAAARVASRSVYAALPAEQELLVEYKLFEPAFYATDLADWGSALLICQELGDRAKVLVDLGHHAQGVEHRADRRDSRRRGPARRLPLQQPQVRRRRPHRRLGQSVRAVPDLRRADRAGRALPRLTIDQSHNVEAKVEAMMLSVRQPPGGVRQGAARRPRRAARARSAAGDVLRGHEVLLDAYNTDVRPLCAKARASARRGRRSDARAARVGLRRAGHRRARYAETVGGGWGR